MNDKTAPLTYYTDSTERRYLRISTNFSVRVFHDAKPTLGRGHDLGAGGMAIYVPLELATGTLVSLSFQLPYSRMILGVRARVRNSEGFRYGVEFVDLTLAELQEIKRITAILELTA
jgi:hypothetical protein